MVIKSAMLIYGIMEYISNKAVDAEKKARARSDVVWKAAEMYVLVEIRMTILLTMPSLITSCNECMNGSKPTDQVKNAYDKLIDLLGVRCFISYVL